MKKLENIKDIPIFFKTIDDWKKYQKLSPEQKLQLKNERANKKRIEAESKTAAENYILERCKKMSEEEKFDYDRECYENIKHYAIKTKRKKAYEKLIERSLDSSKYKIEVKEKIEATLKSQTYQNMTGMEQYLYDQQRLPKILAESTRFRNRLPIDYKPEHAKYRAREPYQFSENFANFLENCTGFLKKITYYFFLRWKKKIMKKKRTLLPPALRDGTPVRFLYRYTRSLRYIQTKRPHQFPKQLKKYLAKKGLKNEVYGKGGLCGFRMKYNTLAFNRNRLIPIHELSSNWILTTLRIPKSPFFKILK